MTSRPFGQTRDGQDVELIILENGRARCVLTTYGAAVVSMLVPDKEEKRRDVVLGFDSIQAYENQDKYIGATIGRYANRIGGAAFMLNGHRLYLEANDGKNHIHGGAEGFDKRVWKAEETEGGDGVRFRLSSPRLDGGYPGNLEAEACYSLNGAALTIGYRAVSDEDTICNLTNHAYFNLEGHDAGTTIMGHMIKLSGAAYTPLASDDGIPGGEILPVDGTPMDFRSFTAIGDRIGGADEQLLFGCGYDHNWVIDGECGRLRPAAEAYSPASGIHLRVATTMPGIQFYTGNYLEGLPPGKNGAVYAKRSAFCLETQFYPDSPNRPGFPQPILRSGELWSHTTVYDFSVTQLLMR